jgi:hypothetical protein
MQRPVQVSAARRVAWLQWRTTGDRCDVGERELSMTEGMTGWLTGTALPNSLGESSRTLPTLAARSGTVCRARLGTRYLGVGR